MNDSIYRDFTLSDLSPSQMRNLKLKLTATNPKLPAYIMENLKFFLRSPTTGNVSAAAVEEQTTAAGVLLHLQRFYPNLRITHLVTISRVHLCHDFASYLRYVMWQLAENNDKDI